MMTGYSPSSFNGYGAVSSISSPIGTTPIAGVGGIHNSIEGLIAAAIAGKSGRLELGQNKYQVDPNQVTLGVIDRRGYYHPGQPNGSPY